jgi:protein gp37
MSDLFDENVPDDFIARVFDVMGQPSITFFRF